MGPVGSTLSANQSFDTFTVAAAIYTVTRAVIMSMERFVVVPVCTCVPVHWIQCWIKQLCIAVQCVYPQCMHPVNGWAQHVEIKYINTRVLKETYVSLLILFLRNKRAQHLLLSAWNKPPDRNRKIQRIWRSYSNYFMLLLAFCNLLKQCFNNPHIYRIFLFKYTQVRTYYCTYIIAKCVTFWYHFSL